MRFLVLTILVIIFSGCAGFSKKNVNKTTAGGLVIQGYYPFWAQKNCPPEKIPFNYLTHLSHAFVYPDAKGNLIVPKNFLNSSVSEVSHKNGCKALLCLGGGGKFSGNFSSMAASPDAVDKFVKNVRKFVEKNNYDGIEIDWEFPDTRSDTKNLTNLLRKLRSALGKEFIINLVVNGTKYLGKWIDVKSVIDYIDYFVIMTYDYHGGWSRFSGHNAPLYPYPVCDSSVKDGIIFWLNKGAEPSKIIFGLPFFGAAFNSYSIGKSFTQFKHMHFKEIQELKRKGFVKMRDELACVPYLKQKNGPWIISYDDEISLKKKIRFAAKNNFAGVMIWEITSDMVNGTNALLPGVFKECSKPL